MEDAEKLAELLEASGVGWLLAESRDERLAKIAQEIAKVSSELSRLLSAEVDVWREMRDDPAALKPLVQMFASPTSCIMRAMVFCVLRGMNIESIDFCYRSRQSVSLNVTLQHDVTGERYPFRSRLVWDVEILRHLGIMKMGDKPILHGFYAFAS